MIQAIQAALLAWASTVSLHREHGPPRAAAPHMEIAVCTGGACLESGAELLVDACSVLAAGDPKLEVKTVFCSGECPAASAMLCPSRGMVEAYEAKCATTEDAIASATAAIEAADSSVSAGLTEAFTASTEAKAAEEAGDMATALAKYSATLACAPADLLEPCQTPLEPETLVWGGSRWAEDVFKSDLSVSESAAATCGGGQALVNGKVVTSPSVTMLEESCAIDGLKYAGRWEDSSGGAGDFEVTMTDDGRAFDAFRPSSGRIHGLPDNLLDCTDCHRFGARKPL